MTDESKAEIPSDWPQLKPKSNQFLSPYAGKRSASQAALLLSQEPPTAKKARLSLLEEPKERDLRCGMFSVAKEDLYQRGGDAVIAALQYGCDKMYTVNDLPDFLDFVIDEDATEGTGNIMCMTDPLGNMNFTEADVGYGLLLCLVRVIGVHHI